MLGPFYNNLSTQPSRHVFVITWSYLYSSLSCLPSEVALRIVLLHLACLWFCWSCFNLASREAEWSSEKTNKLLSGSLDSWHSSATSNLGDREEFTSHQPISQSSREEKPKSYSSKQKTMCIVAQMSVVIYYSHLLYMNGASNNIVHKENKVVQKMFMNLARDDSRCLENKQKQNTVREFQNGWKTHIWRKTCSNDKTLMGMHIMW